jgi:peptidoglycan-associated lipoprotein
MGEGNIPIATPGEELKDAHFSFDSAALSAGAQATLRENAQWLNDNPDVKVVIEGHCDERGTAEYNMALGERRAKAVYDFVRSLGVARERMKTISYGEEMPLDPRSTEDAWAKNRRGHFSIQ